MASRLYRHRQKTNNRRIIVFVILIALLGIFMIKVGFNLLINTAVFVNGLFSSQEATENTTADEDFYGTIDLDPPPTATNSATIILSGEAQEFDTVEFYINDDKVDTTTLTDRKTFLEEVGDLKDGENTLYIVAKANKGKDRKQSDIYTVYYKKEPLTIEIASPADGTTTDKQEIEISGTTDPGTTIHVNNQPIVVDLAGNFSSTYRLKEGDNALVFTARDIAGNEVEEEISVKYEKDD